MNTINGLASEIFDDPDERGRFRCEDAITLDQLSTLYESETDVIEPCGFRNNPRFESLRTAMELVKETWPNVMLRFGGALRDNYSYIDTVWLYYDRVENIGNFEEGMVLYFKSTMRDNMKGICPVCDDRVETVEGYRHVGDDPTLWAGTDEFDFGADDERGKYVRMWWDD